MSKMSSVLISMNENAFAMAVRMTNQFGFCPLHIEKNGACFILPMTDGVEMAKRADREINDRIKQLRKRRRAK